MKNGKKKCTWGKGKGKLWVPPSVCQANRKGHIQRDLQQPWDHQSCKYKSRIRQCINVNVNINVDGFTCKGSWYVASSVEHPILSLITFIVRNIHNIWFDIYCILTQCKCVINHCLRKNTTFVILVNFPKLKQHVIAMNGKNYRCKLHFFLPNLHTNWKQHLNWWSLVFYLIFAPAMVN